MFKRRLGALMSDGHVEVEIKGMCACEVVVAEQPVSLSLDPAEVGRGV
jgi:sarcosine oxidase gamma subunit